MSAFISAAITSPNPEEIAAFGTRGDGKTQGAFGAMVAHAQAHHQAGYPLPTRWLGAADTFASHGAKTHQSMLDPMWKGCWRLRDGGHLAVFEVGGTELVHLRLFGVEDQSGMDRLRAESHGLWFEEPAPSSVLVQSSGLSESAWGLGITSCRLPSYRHPKLMTLNYPDEEHWTWQRFVANPMEGTRYFRIPPGELASHEQREEWKRALANRPDMLRRLLAGQPGAVILGPQVAVGFSTDTHVRPCRPARGFPVGIGQDGGHTPTSVIGQRVDGRFRVLAALTSDHAGIRQHVQHVLLPWLGEHTPWVLDDHTLCKVWYDPSLNTDEQADIEANPLRVMNSLLRGVYNAGPVSWDGRKNPMLSLLNAMNGGQPVLEIDPVQARGLVKALDGGWYYAQGPDGKLRKADTAAGTAQPKKPNHPHEDFGDAFCYLVAGLAPLSAPRDPKRYQTPSKTYFRVNDIVSPKQRDRQATKVDFRVF